MVRTIEKQLKEIKNKVVADDCDACKGGGVVEYVFYHNGESFEKQDDCPVCDGSGKDEDNDIRCIINKKFEFRISTIELIVNACNALNITMFSISETPKNIMRGEFGEFQFAAMPFIVQSRLNTDNTIELKTIND